MPLPCAAASGLIRRLPVSSAEHSCGIRIGSGGRCPPLPSRYHPIDPCHLCSVDWLRISDPTRRRHCRDEQATKHPDGPELASSSRLLAIGHHPSAPFESLAVAPFGSRGLRRLGGFLLQGASACAEDQHRAGRDRVGLERCRSSLCRPIGGWPEGDQHGRAPRRSGRWSCVRPKGWVSRGPTWWPTVRQPCRSTPPDC